MRPILLLLAMLQFSSASLADDLIDTPATASTFDSALARAGGEISPTGDGSSCMVNDTEVVCAYRLGTAGLVTVFAPSKASAPTRVMVTPQSHADVMGYLGAARITLAVLDRGLSADQRDDVMLRLLQNSAAGVNQVGEVDGKAVHCKMIGRLATVFTAR